MDTAMNWYYTSIIIDGLPITEVKLFSNRKLISLQQDILSPETGKDQLVDLVHVIVISNLESK